MDVIGGYFEKNQEKMKVKNVKRKKESNRWFDRTGNTKLQLILCFFNILLGTVHFLWDGAGGLVGFGGGGHEEKKGP